MKLRLLRKVQAWSGIETIQRCSIESPHARQSRAMGRRQFVLEHFHLSISGEEQVAVDTFELTLDLFLAYDRLDTINGRSMALRRQSRALFSE